MKIVYCIAGLRHSGGMERVLTSKANYLAARGHEVVVVTTDQCGENNFFELVPQVQTFDLGINYEENNGKGILNKIIKYPFKQRRHQKKLTVLLKKLRADVVVSMFCNDASFLWKIDDGSSKVLEIHFSRFKRLQYGRKGIWKIIDKLRSKADIATVARYDKFVVLTNEDRDYWGQIANITVIPNPRTFSPTGHAILDDKRVIAVGRLNFQKGFDYLVAAWKLVVEKHPDWKLDIFGNGELKEPLQRQIDASGLSESVRLLDPTRNIGEEYLHSAILAMSSRYEGLPMVLLEAQAYGLPIVSYACKCGPKDVVTHGVDGFLVDEGDHVMLSEYLCRLIGDPDLRKRMGLRAKDNSERFSEDAVMAKWISLFESIREK